MNVEISGIIGAVLVCGGFWTFVQFLISRHDNKKQNLQELKEALKECQESIRKVKEGIDKNNADMALQNEALMALAQDRILFLAREFIKQGWIYDDDLASMRRMANAYRALGGNDLVKTEMDIVDKLPVRTRK